MNSTLITGTELKAARKCMGLSQTSMGERIGYSRQTISYWENVSRPITRRDAMYGAPKDYLAALGIEVLPIKRSRTRARGDGVLLDSQQIWLDRECARLKAKLEREVARHRQLCGAKIRKGTKCRNMSVAGQRRCKFHGGMSTGPRTLEGKERIAAAQKSRWKAYRNLKKS